MRKRTLVLILLVALLLIPASGLAQDYYFSLPEVTADVFYNEDGTASIEYVYVFDNDAFASPIEYVDLSLPNPNFDESSITAEVDGNPLFDISAAGYQGSGPGADTGVAVGLGQYAIPPGETGRFHAFIGTVRRMLFTDDQDENYVSTNFAPAWFDSSILDGTTNLTVTFHFPPGVQPEEPRWHSAPDGFPEEPSTGIDEQGRVFYSWNNPQASMDRAHIFGASFPEQYVPAEVVASPTISDRLETRGISPDTVFGFGLCVAFAGLIAATIAISYRSTVRRKLQYLPPKIAIEGHGIKRGLTAVEAAILLEQPLDKILTMMLFAVIKKNAAGVVTRDPLEIEVTQPLPEGLHPYETKFLESFQEGTKLSRRKALQDMMIDLVRSVSQKMKGFSRRETIAYYRDIMNRAWAQVEAAETPEVKSEKFNENMEWTMLDRDYDDRTRRVFRTGPVFVPVWWPRYDPTYGRGGTVSPVPTTTGAPSGGGISLPNLPGSDFAASIVNGVQDFSSNVIGNINEFTGNITQKTNPVPVSTSSTRSGGGRSGGGCACACACACAGCACACAGGGR